jgi:hypothetical protein
MRDKIKKTSILSVIHHYQNSLQLLARLQQNPKELHSFLKRIAKLQKVLCSHKTFAKYFVGCSYYFLKALTLNHSDLPKLCKDIITFSRRFDNNHLCGPVVRVPGYRSRGSGYIRGSTRFSESSRSGTGSTQPLLFERKSSSSGIENREYGRRSVTLTMWRPLSAKIGTNFADKRRSLGRNTCSSLEDSGLEVVCLLNVLTTRGLIRLISPGRNGGDNNFRNHGLIREVGKTVGRHNDKCCILTSGHIFAVSVTDC